LEIKGAQHTARGDQQRLYFSPKKLQIDKENSLCQAKSDRTAGGDFVCSAVMQQFFPSSNSSRGKSQLPPEKSASCLCPLRIE
jgi:hypothetical protein